MNNLIDTFANRLKNAIRIRNMTPTIQKENHNGIDTDGICVSSDFYQCTKN